MSSERSRRCEAELLKADLIHEDMKFFTSMEQHFLTHDPDIERVLKIST
ncbi:hypothetical protein TNCV_4132591 [Trichonephila clavipes]|nr:hypothetical protein TNCV_4132591 [Trichonephila clavipes]